MPPPPVPHPAQMTPLVSMTMDERRRGQDVNNNNQRLITLSQPLMQQQR